MHQTGPRNGASILQYVTRTLDVHQECHGLTVSVAVSEMRVILHQARGESQWIVLIGYRTISTNIRCY